MSHGACIQLLKKTKIKWNTWLWGQTFGTCSVIWCLFHCQHHTIKHYEYQINNMKDMEICKICGLEFGNKDILKCHCTLVHPAKEPENHNKIPPKNPISTDCTTKQAQTKHKCSKCKFQTKHKVVFFALSTITNYIQHSKPISDIRIVPLQVELNWYSPIFTSFFTFSVVYG